MILDKSLAVGSMTALVRSTIVTVDCAVYHTDRHASVNLVYHMDDYAEENRIYLHGKAEAEVTNNRFCSTYCTIEAN